MITLRNVSFRYDERPILRNVTFEVRDSESAVIMGPSGSGKSTILRLILGLECPQEGCVYVDGEAICHLPEEDKQRIRKGIGMVFQEGALFDSLTVGENVGYYLFEHTKLHDDEIEERVREMLGWVGLDVGEVMDVLPEQLSGGMRRRVAIGRALLATNPKVMLYDEPTTGLDPEATHKVLGLIKRAGSEREISTIVVTHQIPDAIAITHRFIVILEGAVAFDGSLEELAACTDRDVQVFLAPFRRSILDVAERGFV